jgi:hypothetical protein
VAATPGARREQVADGDVADLALATATATPVEGIRRADGGNRCHRRFCSSTVVARDLRGRSEQPDAAMAILERYKVYVEMADRVG